MTVKDLIEQLKQLPPKAKVLAFNGEYFAELDSVSVEKMQYLEEGEYFFVDDEEVEFDDVTQTEGAVVLS